MSNIKDDGNNEGSSPSSPSTSFRESILNSINGRKQHRMMDDTDGGSMIGTVAMGSAMESSSTTGNGHESIQQPSGSTSSNTQSPLRQLKSAFQSRSSTSNREHQSPSRDNGIFHSNNKPLIRRRSSLFDSLPGGSATMTQNSRAGTGANSSRSLLTFVQRLSQDSTLMNDDDEFLDNENQQQDMPMSIAPNNNNNNNKKRKSSLFGAVMKRFGSTNTASTGASGSRSSEIWPSPSTPTRKPSPSTGPKAGIMMSPTGNSIMNVVNRFVMNSPFRFQSPKRTAKRRLTTTATRGNSLHHSPNNTHSNSSLSIGTPSPARKRRKLDLIDENTCSSRSSLHDHDNWQEATIVNNQIHFIDWSIKTKARIECHPPECFWAYRCTQKWRDDLSYWQYNPGTITHSHLPASRVGHSSLGQKTDPPRSKLASEKPSVKQQQTIDQATQILQSINAIRRDRPSSKATTSKAASSSSLSESIQQRASRETRRRWQDAFQSLYIKYCKRMQSVTRESIMDDMLECYFYCVGVDHVVLFSLEGTETIPFNKPRVIISNCCPSFLEEMENAGVIPVLFTDDDENHHKKRKKPPPSPLPKPKIASPMSPTLKADLEALRRAQAFGTTAGADVHVKIHRKGSSISKNLDSNNAQHGPVCFKGMDDVSIFFEFYLNRFGCAAAAAATTTSSNNVPRLAITGPQLPTLVSGGLGPFLHSELSSLMARQALAADTATASSGVATTKGNGGDENDLVPSTKSGDDAVEIEGIILPCMVRKLLVRLSAHMTEEKRRTDGMNTSTTIIDGPNNGNQQTVEADSDDGAHGSHYVVFHSIPDDDELLGIPRHNKCSSYGLTTSFVFNGWPRKSSSEDGKEETNDANAHQIDECSRGRTIQLMVWELNRSNVVACKLQKSVELPRSTITR